jgi:hypothetical protein
MSKLLTVLIASAGLSLASLASAADTMTREAVKAENDKVDAAYKADKERCDALSGNQKDICEAQAKAKRDIAKADIDARNKNTPAARRDAAVKKADAEYEIAKERCDDLAGNAKDVCVKDAKAAHERGKAAAKGA